MRWHRQLGPWPICLLILHAVLITAGYAEADRTGLLHELWLLLTTYPDVLAAAVGLGLLITGRRGVVPCRAPARLRYETWWTVHLYTYLALALAFAHQLANGASFVGHPLARAVWVAAVGGHGRHRPGLPRRPARLAHPPPPAAGGGGARGRPRRGVGDLLRAATWTGWPSRAASSSSGGSWYGGCGGRPIRTRCRPCPGRRTCGSRSRGSATSPRPSARIPPGTRVAIEGPYGVFTDHARQRGRVLLVAAGVGITPIRALLEDLPDQVDVAVILRASRPEDLVLRDEVAAMVRARPGAVLHELVGPRHQVRPRRPTLQRLVPDIRQRDLYVCGPDGFGDGVRSPPPGGWRSPRTASISRSSRSDASELPSSWRPPPPAWPAC